jgi:serine/threonine-protein kinase
MQFCPRDSSQLVATAEAPPGDVPAEGPHCEFTPGIEIVNAAEGRYRVLETVVTTPIGDVSLAKDTFLGRLVTLLTLAQDLPDSEKRELYVRYRALSSIVHPNISTIYSLESIDGRPTSVVEHIQGQYLDDLANAEAPLEPTRAASLVRQIASGLDAVHEAGIIHRDVRPANAVLNPRGVVKVINFSQAFVKRQACSIAPRSMDGLMEKLRWLSPNADPLVEISYTAPEQLRGGDITPQTDIYGAGAILYHLLSGSRPFSAGNLYELMRAITEEAAPQLEMRTSMEAELAVVAMRCLAKDPRDRYESAADLARALDDLERRLQVAQLAAAEIVATQIASEVVGTAPAGRATDRQQDPGTRPAPPPVRQAAHAPDGLPAPGDIIDGKYRIDEIHGRGGMGAVYRATDIDLDRPLALKVLHPQLLTDETAVRRFRQEARSAARLRHPNAVTVYGFGQLPTGAAYIAMEFVEGTTLREELKRRGRLPLDEAAHILGQVADAVHAAHLAGLIHRDLKPDNIMLEQRPGGIAAKVLDFGIAKAVTSSGDTERLTVPHSIIGTPVYMSPEQARGEALDPRSDIYSLGVVVFEMLTGRVPFTADTPVGLALKHVTDAPPSPRSIVPDIPVAIEEIILSALAKDPDDRPQTALELAQCFWESVSAQSLRDGHVTAELTTERADGEPERTVVAASSLPTVEVPPNLPGPAPTPVPTPAPGSDRPLVAVFPLRTLSSNPDDAFFAEGLGDEIVTALSRVEGIGVISRTSSVSYRGMTDRLPSIGAQLGASHVLEGSVRHQGNRVRVTVQLISVARDTHVWANVYDRTLDDVFEVQTEIASEVASELNSLLCGTAARG